MAGRGHRDIFAGDIEWAKGTSDGIDYARFLMDESGARNLRLGDLSDERVIEPLRGYDTLVVYGRNPGDPAAKAVAKTLLAEKKIGKVYLFPGGVDEWQSAGYQFATSNP